MVGTGYPQYPEEVGGIKSEVMPRSGGGASLRFCGAHVVTEFSEGLDENFLEWKVASSSFHWKKLRIFQAFKVDKGELVSAS